ncbi:2OG-Fe dioxygenase family protein [Fluviispira multicolorata]|uniref:2OG-Fe dioxygenase n=1 Tax=Fluviispira multicolorata TaxID=2654512 RepID=A0A833JD58_9BACT|nr:2OG-Fe dioxygenase family protein [Fluviispira multicolorata]KAB8028123.1 hypothetical protein GCL57_13815 [Fluviispira multicolorata]
MDVNSILNGIRENKFYYSRDILNRMISFSANDELEFKKFWDNLVHDNYVEKFTCRKRRIAKFHAHKTIELIADNTVQTSKLYNNISGGMTRYYKYAEDHFLNNRIFQDLLKLNVEIGKKYLGVESLIISCQIFRITPNEDGSKTPVTIGLHKDETHLIGLHFINSLNILGGVSKIFDNDKKYIENSEIVFSEFLESIYIDDTKTFHETTPIFRNNLAHDSFRDVLIFAMEFKK